MNEIEVITVAQPTIEVIVDRGPKGETGEVGPQGLQGEVGPQGLQGLPGLDGSDGADGVDGVDGASAYQVWLDQGNTGTELDFIASLKGEVGPQGIQGIQGLPGINGLDGATGPQGPAGPIGPQGIQGIKGDAGEQGIQGPQGLQGEVGPQGLTGPQGLQGIQGPQGEQGITGLPGVGVPVGGSSGQALVKLSATDHDTAWQTIGGLPGGSNTQIQFNDSGAFAGSSNLTWDGTKLVAAQVQVGDVSFAPSGSITAGSNASTLTLNSASSAGGAGSSLYLSNADADAGSIVLVPGAGSTGYDGSVLFYKNSNSLGPDFRFFDGQGRSILKIGETDGIGAIQVADPLGSDLMFGTLGGQGYIKTKDEAQGSLIIGNTSVASVTGGSIQVYSADENGQYGSVVIRSGGSTGDSSMVNISVRDNNVLSFATNCSWLVGPGYLTGTAGQVLTSAGNSASPTWTSLASVATSGSYTDLTDKPTIPTQYTNADARSAISVSGSLSYDSATGVISYATPSIDSLLPSQSGQAGKVLTTNGTNVSWTAAPTATSILPAQTGNSGKVLTTDGTTATWQTVAGGGGGATAYVYSTSTGTQPIATGSNSLAVGIEASSAAANQSVAVGYQSKAQSNLSVAIGSGAIVNTNAPGAIALGTAQANGSFAVAIGQGAHASSYAGLAVGMNSTTSGYVALGPFCQGNNGVAIGTTATASGFASMAIGMDCTADGEESIAFGRYANTNNKYGSIALRKGKPIAENGIVFADYHQGGDPYAQISTYLMYDATGDQNGTLKTRDSNGSNVLNLKYNTSYRFTAYVVMQNGNHEVRTFKIEGAIKNHNGTVQFIGTPTGNAGDFGDSNTGSWTVNPTTNYGGLSFEYDTSWSSSVSVSARVEMIEIYST